MRRSRWLSKRLPVAACASGLWLGVATAPSAAGTPAAACQAPEYRQFDFWLGHWSVTENGAAAGINRIEAILGGCALLESWTGTGGTMGHSLNAYDAQRKRWHQTWMDDHGTVLHLDGTFRDGAMVLEGERPDPRSGIIRDRITWSPLPNGDVRQLWESRQGADASWQVVFDGIYRRTI